MTRNLRDDASHYCYEVEMLVATATELIAFSDHALRDKTNLTTNAFIESWCIHARNLIEFLLPTRQDSDSIAMADFLTKPLSDGPEEQRCRALKTPLNKRLAHLSSARNKTFKGWEIRDRTVDFITLSDRFVAQVTRSQPDRAAFFSRAVAAHEQFRPSSKTGSPAPISPQGLGGPTGPSPFTTSDVVLRSIGFNELRGD